MSHNKSLDVSLNKSPSLSSDDSPFLSDWGFTLKELYNLSIQFYKEKQGKAMHFSYEERLKLSSLTCQVNSGKFDPDTAPPIGVLDVIGKDRRVAWQALGDKNKADCMFEFITLVNKQCPLFKPFIEAHKRDTEEKNRIVKETEEDHKVQNDEMYRIAKDLERQAEENREQMEEQKRRIQDALNNQTFEQFKNYAEQQFPGNPEQQGVLIRQLQEQHYEQYMRQLYQQQLYAAQQQKEKLQAEQLTSGLNKSSEELNSETTEQQIITQGLQALQLSPGPRKEREVERLLSSGDEKEGIIPGGGEDEESEEEEESGSGSGNTLAAASMWTRKDINEFKESVKAEGGEAVIRINQGESVTVRVPTHPEGSCLFWEFATDAYDIGFGLFFEWTNTEEQVSVHVTEESSEEEEDDDEAFQQLEKDLSQDVEKGKELLPKGAKPNTDIIIPVYRRDAQNEVYVGSHLFPGKGVYLLKFDNSYSFWRSKTLYYRVYYTK